MLPTILLKECSEFLEKSNGRPLYKVLPSTYGGFKKIKIRKKSKHKSEIEKYFDLAFYGIYKDLRLRSMLAHLKKPTVETPETHEVYYVFPKNGFKVIYNSEIGDYENYIKELEDKVSKCENKDLILKELFSFSYNTVDFSDIDCYNDNDLLIYNIPYYYAIKGSLIDNYSEFVKNSI